MHTGVHRFLAFELLVNPTSSGTLAFSLRLAPFLLTASSDTPASSLRLMPPPLAIGALSLRPGSSAPSPKAKGAEDQVDEPRHLEFQAQEPGVRTNWNQLRAFLDGIVWSCLTILSTIWVLGGDDIYILSDPPLWADRPVYSLYVICFFQVPPPPGLF